MAERRMFARSIVLSDAFLDMPMSARCLYFTLGMVADDDGFVGSPKTTMRMCGASMDDLNILLAKRYLLGFKSGVVVVKHWRINNYLQNDRHKTTTYVEEKETLTFDQKGSYTERKDTLDTDSDKTDTECIQVGYKTDTQDSIGKDSIGNNIVLPFTNVTGNTHSPSVEGESAKTPKNPIDFNKIVEEYNKICVSFPKLTKLSEDRKKAIRARFNSKYSMADFIVMFKKAEASDFLKGSNNRNWSATFDWMVRDANMAKILDGNYDNGKQPVSLKGNNRSFRPRDITGQYDDIKSEVIEV